MTQELITPNLTIGRGIYYNMPDHQYHATPDLSASGIKLLLDRTPLHFWDRYLNPNREQKPATTFQVIGKAWHASIFEPERFADTFAAEPDWSKNSKQWTLLVEYLESPEAFTLKYAEEPAGIFEKSTSAMMLLIEYIGNKSDADFLLKYTSVPDGINKRTKAGKELFSDLEEMGQIGVEESILKAVIEAGKQLVGKTLINADMLAAVIATAAPLIGKELLPVDKLADVILMQQSARAYPPAVEWLDQKHKGVGESSIFWTDPETGAHCKIRPDYMIPPCAAYPLGLIIDGKSAEDASAEGFARAIWSYDYMVQAAHYTDGFMQHFGTDEPPPFIWLVQEKESPFATVAYRCSDAQREYGMRRVIEAREMYAECMATGVWPGYTAEVGEIEMPGYAQKQIDGDGEGEIEVQFLTEGK